MWTYGGTFPGPTIRRPAGHRTEVTFRHELPAKAGELTVHLHGGHNRSEYDGQPGGLTASHPFSSTARSRRGSRRAGPATTCCSGPERAKGTSTTWWRTAGPSGPRSSGTTTTASTTPRATYGAAWRGCGSSTTTRRVAAAAARRLRHPADDRRPLLRSSQPAHRPLHRGPAPAGRRDRRQSHPRQRRSSAAPPGRRPPLPVATPQRLPVPRLQHPPLQRRGDDPGRNRQRPDAAPGEAPRDPARPCRARRGDRRLLPLGRRLGGTAQRRGARPRPRRPPLRRRPCAVPRRSRARARREPRASQAAAAARVDEARLAQARPDLDDLDRRLLHAGLGDQRQDVQPGPLRRLSRARHDRDVGNHQQDRRRPHAPSAPHRLVPALPGTAGRRRPGKTASRRPSSSTRGKGSAWPATSPTTRASTCSTATCSTTRITG